MSQQETHSPTGQGAGRLGGSPSEPAADPRDITKPGLTPEERAAYRILVVDDEAVVREVIAAILKRRGYQAEAVSSGPEALERIAEDAFTCVLSDVTMPEMNGIDLCGHLHECEPNLPVILMSGIEIPPSHKLAEIGASAALLKPLRWPQLLEIIDTLCAP